jgi:hypothetical protein
MHGAARKRVPVLPVSVFELGETVREKAMSVSGDPLVFWILVPLFTAVGLYLFWYSRRRKAMLEVFARRNGLQIRPGYRGRLQKRLDKAFPLEGKGLARSFSRLSSIVDGGSVWIFRAIELLDLNPHAQAYTTHHHRVAALFDVPPGYAEFFLLDKSRQARTLLPGAAAPGREVTGLVRRLAAFCKVRHTLSVTLAGRYGLIYFEPLVAGGETLEDVESLYCLAIRMRDALAKCSELSDVS